MLSWLSTLVTPLAKTSSAAFGRLGYVKELAPGVTPASGNSNALRITSPTLKANVKSLKSAEIHPSRLVWGSVNADLDVAGGFDMELSAGEYDPFITSALCSTWVHYGAAGVGDAGVASAASSQITFSAAPTGASALSNLLPGTWFKLYTPSAPSATRKYFARKWLKCSSTTSTTINLDASTQVSGAGLSLSSSAGSYVRQSTASNGSDLSSYTLEWGQLDVRQFFQYSGMRVDTVDLKVSAGSLVTGAVSFVGMGHSVTGSSVLPGVLQPSLFAEPLNATADVSLLLESGTDLMATGSFIKSIQLTVSNNLRAQKAVGVYGAAGIGLGELSVSGSVEMYLSDASYYRKWLAGAYTSLTFGMSDEQGNSYLFELDRVKFRDGNLNRGRDSDVMLSLGFDAVYSATTGRGIRVTRG
jgi:hypothetical protein